MSEAFFSENAVHTDTWYVPLVSVLLGFYCSGNYMVVITWGPGRTSASVSGSGPRCSGNGSGSVDGVSSVSGGAMW